jgi:hypothetical protein
MNKKKKKQAAEGEGEVSFNTHNTKQNPYKLLSKFD